MTDLKRIHINQPRYLPSLNYFHRMILADEFVYLDTVKYSDGDWENRNKIMTQHGPQWLSVPVYQESSDQLIQNSYISEQEKNWARKHKRTLQMNYAKAPCFEEVFPLLEEMYDRDWKRLMDVNIHFVDLVCDYLDISCTFLKASDMEAEGEGEELLLRICREREAAEYLSGTLGRNYLTPELWEEAGIKLTIHEYNFPEYEQGEGEFIPWLSIVDLLMHHGRGSRSILDTKSP